MKYQSLELIALEADVHPGIGIWRCERLERWAELLEGQPDRRLCAMEGSDSETAANAKPSALTILRSPWRSKTRCCVLRGFGAIGLATRSSFSTLARRGALLGLPCHHGLTIAPDAVAVRVGRMAPQDKQRLCYLSGWSSEAYASWLRSGSCSWRFEAGSATLNTVRRAVAYSG
jgi:hypothetical protein